MSSPGPRTGERGRAAESEATLPHPDGAVGPDQAQRQAAPFGKTMDCVVAGWNASLPKPLLTLGCPSAEKTDRFRVIMQLSWMDGSEQPSDYPIIVAPVRTRAKLCVNQEGAYVWLSVQAPNEPTARRRWVKFSELVSLNLQTED